MSWRCSITQKLLGGTRASQAANMGRIVVNRARKALARKIRDFINTKGLAMVQIRCLRGFETKSEAFA